MVKDTSFYNSFKVVKYYDSTDCKWHIKSASKPDTSFTERKIGIEFINSSGKTIKRIPYKDMIVNGKMNYILQNLPIKNRFNKSSTCYEFYKCLINAKGVIKWKKIFKSYTKMKHGDDPYDFHQEYGISSNSGVVFVQYRDSTEKYYIDIIDTTGDYLMKIQHTSPFYEIKISPDGKILVAPTDWNQNSAYFITDVTTQRMMIIRDTMIYKDTILNFTVTPLEEKKIDIYGEEIGFEELPIGLFPFDCKE
jgi:hypothetical protein